jgi:hypothetical protein
MNEEKIDLKNMNMHSVEVMEKVRDVEKDLR